MQMHLSTHLLPRYVLGVFATLVSVAWRALAADPVEPKVIDPGPPPSDAIILFDGKDLSQWTGDSGAAAKWIVRDGYVEVNGTGSIMTQQQFGDVQLHVEWATPSKVVG